MKLFRIIPVCIAATTLILVQAVPAQSDQAAGAATKAEKKAKKAKKEIEPTSGMTGAAQTEKGMAQMPGTATTTTKKAKGTTTGSAARAATVSESDIAAAKASGKVWVNTETGVYHKSSDRWYGATKQGKFMTEEEATKAGYRASKAK